MSSQCRENFKKKKAFMCQVSMCQNKYVSAAHGNYLIIDQADYLAN